jgi:hypothetical protein
MTKEHPRSLGQILCLLCSSFLLPNGAHGTIIEIDSVFHTTNNDPIIYLSSSPVVKSKVHVVVYFLRHLHFYSSLQDTRSTSVVPPAGGFSSYSSRQPPFSVFCGAAVSGAFFCGREDSQQTMTTDSSIIHSTTSHLHQQNHAHLHKLS